MFRVVDQMTDLVLNLATKAHRECSTDQRRMAYLAKLSLITALTQEDVMKEEEFDNHPLRKAQQSSSSPLSSRFPVLKLEAVHRLYVHQAHLLWRYRRAREVLEQ